MGQLLFFLVAGALLYAVGHWPRLAGAEAAAEPVYWLLVSLYCANLARVLWQPTHLFAAAAFPASFAQTALTFGVLAAVGRSVLTSDSSWLFVLAFVGMALMGLYERQAPRHFAAWQRAGWKAGPIDVLLARHIPPLTDEAVEEP